MSRNTSNENPVRPSHKDPTALPLYYIPLADGEPAVSAPSIGPDQQPVPRLLPLRVRVLPPVVVLRAPVVDGGVHHEWDAHLVAVRVEGDSVAARTAGVDAGGDRPRPALQADDEADGGVVLGLRPCMVRMGTELMA